MPNFILTIDLPIYDGGQQVATAKAGSTVRGQVRSFGVLSFACIVGESMILAEAQPWEYKLEGGQNG